MHAAIRKESKVIYRMRKARSTPTKKKDARSTARNVCCVEGVSRGSVFIASFPAVLGGVALRPVIINPTSG